MMTIEQGRLRLTFDRHGSPIRVEDTRTGVVHTNASREDARLFRLIVPRPRWASRPVDNALATPTITEQDGQIIWRFPHAQLPVEVRISRSPRPDELLFQLSLTNAGPDTVTEVSFPWLTGWSGLDGKGKDTMILGAATEVDPHSFPRNWGLTYARVHQRHAVMYPVGMYAPWVDLSGARGGLSYVSYDERPRNAYVSLENLAGYQPGLRLGFSFAFYALVRPGESWSSPPVGIAVHAGDWHDTADRYRQWADTWFQPPPTPRRARAGIGFQNVFLRGFDGTPFRPLDAIPRIAEEGRRYGVDMLSVWDYVILGNYSKRDDLDLLDYTAAEKAVLKAGLQRAKAEGTNVNALINFRLIAPGSSLYKREGHAELIRSLDGSPRMEAYPWSHHHGTIAPAHLGPLSQVLSPLAPTYRQRVLRQTREYIELGFNSMFFDQPFEMLPDYGRLAEGGIPEFTYDRLLDLIRQVRQLLHSADSDALMIGEYCEIFAAQSIDLWMAWYSAVAPATRAAYSIPQPMHSWVVDSSPAQASHAFALGMYLCLCTHGIEGTLADEPAFGEHVAALGRLRRQCAERTVFARFNHSRGLQVESADGLVAYSYDGPLGPAVIVAAPGPKGAIQVTLDRSRFAVPGQPDRGTLHWLSGRVEPVTGDTQRFTLGENEVAVWLA